VRGIDAKCPTVARAFEPSEIVHETRDLELDVVGSRQLDEIGALETVIEDRQATFVVGVSRGVERTEQLVDAGVSLHHLRHPSVHDAALATR